jgi:hypothetical protein
MSYFGLLFGRLQRFLNVLFWDGVALFARRLQLLLWHVLLLSMAECVEDALRFRLFLRR